MIEIYKITIKIMTSTNSSFGICYKCNTGFECVEDEFECDSCISIFHLKCAGVTKTEYNARNRGKNLRLFCTDCIEKKENGIEGNVNKILKFIYKLDVSNQEDKSIIKKNGELMTLIAKKMINVEKNYDKLGEKMTNVIENSKTTSYADIVKEGRVKPVVVIKPKNQQTSKKTMEEIINNISKSDVNICNTRNSHNGSIVFSCASATDTMKVKQVIGDKLGDCYDVHLPEIKKPRLRVSNIDADIPNDKIIDVLKSNNKNITDIDMRLITVINRNIRGNVFNEAVIELDCNSYKKMLKIGLLNLPWRECRIYQHLYLKRCFKCCGYSHKSFECKFDQKCSLCAGTHKFSECKTKTMCCINCKMANEKFRLHLNTKHHAFSRNCSILQQRMSKLQSNIEYNETK